MLKPSIDPRTGVYYFRKVVPKNLRNIIQKSEIKVSLKTKDYSEAMVKFHQEASYCEQLFNNAKLSGGFSLSNKAIKQIAGKWLSSKLIDDDAVRLHVNPEQSFMPNTDDTYNSHISTLDGCLDGNDFSLIEEDIRFVIRTNGLPIYKGNKEYYTLAREIIMANIRYYQVIKKRYMGDYSDKLEDVLASYPSNNINMTLNDLFRLYEKNSNKPATTISTYKNAVNKFMELYPQSSVSDIDRAMVRNYRDQLLQVPRLKPRTNHMTLPELARYSRSNKIDDFISPATVNKNIKSIGAVLSWGESSGYFDDHHNWSNPTHRIRADESNKKPRLPFDDSDIKAIFDNDYNLLTGYKFWIPLISLYSGARLEEIGQLLVSDIKKDKEFGFWYMDINEIEEGKMLKNKSASRLVPIHNKLIELGFIEFLDDSGQVFKDLSRTSSNNKLTPKVSKWFSKYRKKKGVTGAQKTFHSFRHLFKDVVRSQIGNEELSDAITGHTNSSIGRKYGSGYGLSKLNKGMQSLQFDIGSVLKYDSER